MSRPKNKDEYRKELAETFINVLNEKGLAWKKEWNGVGGNAPQNGVTKANYKGINTFWLSMVAAIKGYDDPRWVTMVQIMDKDNKYHPNEKWHLKAGSKATYVEYWYPYDLKNRKAITWEKYSEEIKNGRKNLEFKFSTKYTAVFNACDIDGISEFKNSDKTAINTDEIVKKLSQNMKVPILSDGGDRAYYSPSSDEIHLPTFESFENEYAYNSTALHELAHSTGHPLRLNRAISNHWGGENYAYEELVAEMCSCFMGINLEEGLNAQHIDNHKAYVQSWIFAINKKPEALVKAINDAQSAANYMEYKAELISEKEYKAALTQAIEITKSKNKKKEPIRM